MTETRTHPGLADHPIYLDYNGTTPIDPRVVETMLPYLTMHFGNPSSSHFYAHAPHTAIETAREVEISLRSLIKKKTDRGPTMVILRESISYREQFFLYIGNQDRSSVPKARRGQPTAGLHNPRDAQRDASWEEARKQETEHVETNEAAGEGEKISSL